MAHQNINIFSLILQAGPLVKLVLFILLAMSVTSWGVIALKWVIFKNAFLQNKAFLHRFANAKNLDEIEKGAKKYPDSPASRLFTVGATVIEQLGSSGRSSCIESLNHSMTKTIASEITRLEKAVPYLATVGSTAPFIGLFGTVWGIMNSFRNIGSTGAANLAVVAPGIAEALIATAAGLAAAIPAVVAYNFFVQRLRKINSELEGFSVDFIFLTKSSILKS